MASRPLRNTDPEKVHLITCRTVRSELLLVPRPKLNNIVGGVIAKYRSVYEVELFGTSILSNHYHLLVRAPKENLIAFAENVNREIAKRVNYYLGRTTSLWGRRYDDQIVVEEKDALEAFLYIVANPVKHGLVTHPKHWPGVDCFRQLHGAKPKEYSFFNFTEYNKARILAKTSGTTVKRSDYETSYTLRFTPLSSLPFLEQYTNEKLAELVEERVEQLVEQRRAEGKEFLGRKRVLSQPIMGAFPGTTKKTHRPRCYSKSPRAIREFRKEEKILRAQYDESSIAFRSGDYSVEFPQFTIRPPAHHVPRCHEM